MPEPEVTQPQPPQPPYPIRLPASWPEDTPFDQLPPPIRRRIEKALAKEAEE